MSGSPSPAPKPPAGFVRVGTVVGGHGTDGRIRIIPESDNPDRFQSGGSIWVGDSSYAIERVQPTKGGLLIKLYDVEWEAAEAMTGEPVLVRESAVPQPPEDTYYHFQLIDLLVRTVDGQELGVLTEILDTGANDVYVVTSDGQELLLPAMESVVREVNLDRGEMVVVVTEGLEPRSTISVPKRKPPRKRKQQAQGRSGPSAPTSGG